MCLPVSMACEDYLLHACAYNYVCTSLCLEKYVFMALVPVLVNHTNQTCHEQILMKVSQLMAQIYQQTL